MARIRPSPPHSAVAVTAEQVWSGPSGPRLRLTCRAAEARTGRRSSHVQSQWRAASACVANHALVGHRLQAAVGVVTEAWLRLRPLGVRRGSLLKRVLRPPPKVG